MPIDTGLTVEQRDAVDTAMAALDLDTKCGLLAGHDMWTLPGIPGIGLEPVVMSDGPIGVRGRQFGGDPTVALPSPTAQAATWDVDLARTTGRLLAAEARRKGVHVLLAPTVNLHRTPRGGRNFEAYSEDPLLTARIAGGFVTGVQDGGVATTAKHFVANDAETDRMTVDNRVDPAVLRELYLAPFHHVVAQGGWGIMSAHNAVNGTTMTGHARLQDEVLRDQWGFRGFVVSDWTAARDTVAAITAGTDLAMPGPVTVYGPTLAHAVRSGHVPESLVDASVRRVLELAARVGALADAPPTVPADRLPDPVDADRHAREVARRSFVLLRNERGLLPLRPGARIAVIGLPATEPQVMGGGSAQVFPHHVVSPWDGLCAALPDAELTHVAAIDPRPTLPAVRDGFTLRVVARDADERIRYEAPLPDGQIRWVGETPNGLDLTTIHSVEITGGFTPSRVGTHQFSFAGVGRFEFAVRNAVLFDADIAPDTADPVNGLLNPPERRAVIDLAADVPVDVSLMHHPAAPRGMPFPLIAFRLGHCEPLPDPDDGIAAAASAAHDADVAVVCVTTTDDIDREGADRDNLALPGRQNTLVEAVAAANPDTVVLVSAGAPVEMPWADDVAAILLTWFGGQELGNAVADVLTGEHEPAGRLPTTWPARLGDAPVTRVEPDDEGQLRYREGRFVGYRGWLRDDVPAPAWWFGHGLGYTDWRYDSVDVTMSDDDGTAFDNATVASATGGRLATATVRLTNIGTRPGRQVVQLYLEPLEPAERPRRWLAGFAGVTAAPGDTVDVDIDLPRRVVHSWDTGTGTWRTRTGDYRLLVGRTVADIAVHTDLTVT